jgi:hypothetical protein
LQRVAALLRGLFVVREVHPDAPHHLLRNGEEVGPILPTRVSPVDEAQVSLIHQIVALLAHVPVGQPPQLAIDKRH